MPYVSKSFLGRALEALAGQHALLLFSIPAMTRAGLPSVASQDQAEANPHRFGSAEEKELLDQYYRVDGSPEGRPYFNPGSGEWVVARYGSGTTLQRQRKDRAKLTDQQLFFETGGRNDRGYALRSDIADRIVGDHGLLPNGPIPLVALGAWLYRAENVRSPEEIVERVKADLKLDRDGLIGPVYSDGADEIPTSGWSDDAPIGREALLDLLKAPPPPPPPRSLGSIAELVTRIEEAMRRAGVVLAEGVVARVVRAWLNRDVAVLVGAPGTGKTTFAREFANACETQVPDQRDTIQVLVDPDFDAARLLGYLDLAGRFQPSEFTTKVLRTSQPRLPRVVVLEEWNTAQVEAYLGQLLHAIEGDGTVQLSDDSEPRLPLDVLLLATCNSVRDEPETRLPMSRPTKRRTTIIEMPNILFEAWQEEGRDGLRTQIDQYLAYERERVERREEEAPALDELRAARLAAVQTLAALDADTAELILDLVEYLFGTDDGQNFMTVGLLIDLLRDVIYAEDDPLGALGWQITGKVLEQVTDMAVARGLAERCVALPNAEMIRRAVDRMDLHDGSVSPIL